MPVLAGEATATPKTRTGIVESIRVLRVARAGALKARTQAANQLRDLLVTAPEELHAELYPLPTAKRVQRLAAQQPSSGADPASATRRALCHLARRYQALTVELDALDADLAALTRRAAPRLLARYGVGVETAGKLLVTAGDNPDRLHSDAALAALCGASPVEASSGKTIRHRSNRGGDRQANNALWIIAASRSRTSPSFQRLEQLATDDASWRRLARRRRLPLAVAAARSPRVSKDPPSSQESL